MLRHCQPRQGAKGAPDLVLARCSPLYARDFAGTAQVYEDAKRARLLETLHVGTSMRVQVIKVRVEFLLCVV